MHWRLFSPFYDQAHHLRCLNDFVDAQAAYYAQCYQYMVNLQKQLGRLAHIYIYDTYSSFQFPLFSPSVKLWCKHMYIVISIFKPPVVTVPLSPPAFHPHSLITISRVAAPPPVSQFPRHRRPPHFPLCHQTRPHPRSTSSAAPRAPARPVCCTTTTLPAAVSSLCSLMRCAFIILFRLA